MPDQTQSRIIFGQKELLQLLGIAVFVGGAWVMLNATSASTRANAEELKGHERRITVMEEAVKDIEEDVGDIKIAQKEFNTGQQDQRLLLNKILVLVKRNGRP